MGLALVGVWATSALLALQELPTLMAWSTPWPEVRAAALAEAPVALPEGTVTRSPLSPRATVSWGDGSTTQGLSRR